MIAQAILSSQPTIIREVPVPPTSQLVVAAATAQAVIATAQAVLTAADRVQTGEDAVATAADRVQTGEDVIATAADRVQTGEDVIATAASAEAAALSETNAGDSESLALTYKTESQAAQAAAEVARDAALSSGNVYANTAAGIAATTTGQYFSVVDHPILIT